MLFILCVTFLRCCPKCGFLRYALNQPGACDRIIATYWEGWGWQGSKDVSYPLLIGAVSQARIAICRKEEIMKLKLVKAADIYQRQITDMLDEWYASGEKIVPYAIRRTDYHNFKEYCEKLEVQDSGGSHVPDSTFFCLDEDRDIMVGAVNIRHYLNESLLLNGGHIGDGVRPSERRKGIATKMIGLALRECRQLGINEVLMVCDRENIGSAKSIINNGGILENEVEVDGVIEQRYWIALD